tara:strand:+ start:764 stop:985 length:222 start_codon:yes stop_codon:yes gene_type:complete
MGEKPLHSLPDEKVGVAGTSEGVHDISPEEMQGIFQSVGALGTQVKANEKSKANANKAKGYAKAKTIGKKYGT